MHGLGVSTHRLRSFDAYELTMDRPIMLVTTQNNVPHSNYMHGRLSG